MARRLDSRQRAALYRVLLVARSLSAGISWSCVLDNLLARRIASGFGFLFREAGFEIGESTVISFSAADSLPQSAHRRPTRQASRGTLLAVVFSTFIGVAVGLARLSPNWLLAKLASGYVELLRNIPLVVQLFFWYAVITESLPAPAQALHPLPGFFLSNRGLALPSIASLLPFEVEYPSLSGFNFSGGVVLSPEFAALLLGLTLYTAAFIGEIVRAGILAVDRGQSEAAQSRMQTKPNSCV